MRRAVRTPEFPPVRFASEIRAGMVVLVELEQADEFYGKEATRRTHRLSKRKREIGAIRDVFEKLPT